MNSQARQVFPFDCANCLKIYTAFVFRNDDARYDCVFCNRRLKRSAVKEEMDKITAEFQNLECRMK